MTPDNDIDEVAVAAAMRRLDAIVERHPELCGPSDADNVTEWMEILDEKGLDDMTKDKEATTQVAFRLPNSLIARLDRHAEKLTKEHPGLEFSRVDAVRTLLTRALDEVESKRR